MPGSCSIDGTPRLAKPATASKCSWPTPVDRTSRTGTSATGRSRRASRTGRTSRCRRSRVASSRKRPGTALDPDATLLELGSIVQKGGKVVHAWAVEGDLDPADARSNDFEVEWPPRSGRRERFAEIDRVEWFAPDEARRRIKPTQQPFIDRLETALRG